MADPYPDFAIYDRRESGLIDVNPAVYDRIGEVNYVGIHHSAGSLAETKAEAVRLNRAYQRYHMVEKGWLDIGYNWMVDNLGRFYAGRPSWAMGAHVEGHNPRNIGIMFHGNFDIEELTEGHKRAIEWLFKGGFYRLFGEQEAGIKAVLGHREFSGHASNRCPGNNLLRHLRWRRDRDFH